MPFSLVPSRLQSASQRIFRRQSVVVAVANVAQAVDVVDAADVRRRHCAERPRRLEVVAVVQRRGGRAGPIGEARGPHAGSHEVQFGDPRERDGGEVPLELVDGLLSG